MNNPVYESCSLEELLDIEQQIDKDQYPDRYQEVLKHIELRRQGVPPTGVPAATPGTTTMDADLPSVGPLTADLSTEQSIDVRFTGSGDAYFRIWIINTLLSIVTLGIYSAWATVRNRRYLYGHTEIGGSRFDFHGDPVAILKGRAIAVTVFLAYAFGGDLHPYIPIIAIFIMILGFPWVMVSAMRFRLANTSWRSLRFRFTGEAADAYRLLAGPVGIFAALYAGLFLMGFFGDPDALSSEFAIMFLGWMIVFLIVSIWAVPVLNYRARNFMMNHCRFGDHDFEAELSQSTFRSAYLGMIGWGFLAGLIASITMGVIMFVLGPMLVVFDETAGFIVGLVFTYAIIILAYLLPFAYWQCRVANHVLSSTRLEQVRFTMSLDYWTYWGILVTNAALAIITLGLAIPWTKIRMIRYKLSCLVVEGDASEFTGKPGGDDSATGDELGEAFDIDFGF